MLQFVPPLLQSIKALRSPSLLPALLLLPGLLSAGAQQPPIPPKASHIALPQLNDGMGWKQPKYYSTMTVDLGWRWAKRSAGAMD
jgi:hypothetical protein